MIGTINPDFGSVESDDVVINLSATETFFLRKDLFFLRGRMSLWRHLERVFAAMADSQMRVPHDLVNTRRIGGKPKSPAVDSGISIPDAGLQKPVDLVGALKVIGQSGKVRYGFLSAFEDNFSLSAIKDEKKFELAGTPSDYGIIRLLYERNDKRSYRALGFMSTAVLNDEGDVLTHGLDGHYLSEDGKFRVDGQFFTSKFRSFRDRLWRIRRPRIHSSSGNQTTIWNRVSG